jgi:hypothetical protein
VHAAEFEQQIRNEVSVEEQQLMTERAQLAAAQEALERDRAELVGRQASIEVELQAIRDGRSFKKYVLERAASDDYRKQLGLIAAVHRDFKSLSERLGDPGEPHVDRIVLYIDDLDRCPPERVVEVLQAVHLILSLPLFVVLVAVDSRWLLQSLRAYYAKQFLGTDATWESKPQHYLEKIFQIPYALPPMQPAGFKQLAANLLGKHIRARPESESPRSNDANDPRPEAKGVEGFPTKKQSGGHGQPSQVESPPAASPARLPIDLSPPNLEIEKEELDFLVTVAPLISSPRSAKRLVNLYRLIRATLDEDELRRFVGGRYKTTLLLLAAVVGSSSLAAELFEAIFAVASSSDLDSYLDQKSKSDQRWSALAKLLANRQEMADWDEVRSAARAASRYSFETGRVLRA